MTMQGEFEMINLILDFAPGAATPAHNHGGPGIVTVLEGELTFGVEGRPDQMAQPGGVYVDLPGTAHTAANNTSNPARVSYAVVLPKGATLTTLVGGVQAPTPPQGMPRTGQGDPVALLVVIQALAAGLLFIGIGGLVRGRGTRLR
jgi:quercetin dioxygenase-like cupin family protein